MSKFLIQERPSNIMPSLNVKLRVDEAVVLQQMHYWVVKSTYFRDNRRWVYNTYSQWQEQLPFWSERSLSRTIQSLSCPPCSTGPKWTKQNGTRWIMTNWKRYLQTVRQDSSLARTSCGASNGGV